MSFVPHSDADRREMLAKVGAADVEDLYSDIPSGLLLGRELDVPTAMSEWEAVREVAELADRNAELVSFAGGGMYDHYVPAAVDHIIRRSEFYTAYTPYQPEVAQGTLQVIYEFQTMICELTGMEVANASMYDGPTATAEAAVMARSVRRRDRVLAARSLHPHSRKVTNTYLEGLGNELELIDYGPDGLLDLDALKGALAASDDDVAAVLVQYPNFFGGIEELGPIADAVHEAGALLVVQADPVMLTVLRSPGSLGADIVTAEGQPLGNSPSFGGPVVGLFAASEKLVRKMPGRIVGATVDVEGRRGYVLTLQTREQQIRRERATSNICTNQGLMALAATVYMSLLGRAGLRQVAETSIQNAHYARRELLRAGVELLFPDAPVAREFVVKTREDSRRVIEKGAADGLLAGVSLRRFRSLDVDDGLLVAFTEKRNRSEIDRLVELLGR